MKIRGIRKTYNIKSAQPVIALNDISFDLPEVGMIFILGKSGSGKSTLLNVLSGLDKVDKGHIEICGKDITKLSESELCNYRNSCCGFVFQEYNLIPELSVGENIMLALQLQGEKDAESKVREILERVGLSEYETRKVTELSGGQKQRVAIARAIVKNPNIIFADEPTGALDEQTGKSILDLLKEFSKNKLVIVVTHDKEFAKKYGDKVIELADGKIVSDSDETKFIQEGTETEAWKKPKLPIKIAFKIGCSNFKYHPIRLLATMFLSIVAFTFLGFSLNMATINPTNNYVKAIHDNNVKYTALYKYNTYRSNEHDMSLDQFLGASNLSKEKSGIAKSDVETFQNVYADHMAFVYAANIYSFRKSIAATNSEINKAKPGSDKHFAISSDGYISLDADIFDKPGFSMVGDLPQNGSEIAINECMLNTFMLSGLLENGNTFPIKNATDIIGHTISITHNSSVDLFKTITGVVYTGCSKQCYMSHQSEGYHDKIIVCDDYFSSYSYALCEIEPNYKNFAEAVAKYNSNNVVFKFSNPLSDGYYSSYSVAIMLKTLCLYVSIVFLVFAVILLINFIAVSIRGQMKQIGILSSLGSNFKQMIKIYYINTICLYGLVYLISLLFVGVLVGVVNSYLKGGFGLLFNLISFSPIIGILLIISILAASVLGNFFPLLNLKKYTPVDIINEGQIK